MDTKFFAVALLLLILYFASYRPYKYLRWKARPPYYQSLLFFKFFGCAHRISLLFSFCCFYHYYFGIPEFPLSKHLFLIAIAYSVFLFLLTLVGAAHFYLRPEHKKVEENNRRAADLVNMAYHLVESGRYVKAKELLLKAIKLNDKVADAHSELSFVHSNLGDFNAAYRYAMNAVELDKENPKFYNSVAFSLAKMNRNDEALDYALKALDIDTEYAAAHLSASKIMQKLNYPDKDIEFHISKARDIYENTKIRSDGTPLRRHDLERFFPK